MVARARASGNYRADGVKITHDPFDPRLAAKYGSPGNTDSDGFDPRADTVGAGIYGGTIQRDEKGSIVLGRQYQNHNPRPGPVYTGGGYTPINTALRGPSKQLAALLDSYPDLANDVSTGGATPLHMCGMGRTPPDNVAVLVQRGADLEAVDSYGFTPLHRMASNNRAAEARVLLAAGADPSNEGAAGPVSRVAAQSEARDFMKVLADFPTRREVPTSKVVVVGAGEASVNTEFAPQPGSKVPAKFAEVCVAQGWSPANTWKKLSGEAAWYEATNESYIYFNIHDQHWWLDGPDGLGLYKARGLRHAIPGVALGAGEGKQGWYPIDAKSLPVPTVLSLRDPGLV